MASELCCYCCFPSAAVLLLSAPPSLSLSLSLSSRFHFLTLFFKSFTQAGNLECVQELLRLNADVNRGKSKDGITALYSAAQHGRFQVLKTLLSTGGRLELAFFITLYLNIYATLGVLLLLLSHYHFVYYHHVCIAMPVC